MAAWNHFNHQAFCYYHRDLIHLLNMQDYFIFLLLWKEAKLEHMSLLDRFNFYNSLQALSEFS